MSKFKEFLEIYNRTTERCFRDCVVDLNHRSITLDEDKCLDDCTTKLTNLNHRLLSTFMVEQPKITEQKIEMAKKERDAAMQAMSESQITPKV